MSSDHEHRAASRRRDVVVAGHRGDAATATAALTDPDAGVRVAALGALDRIGELADGRVTDALADPAPAVRRRACELAATRLAVSLRDALADPDPTVVEVAAWACGEQVDVLPDGETLADDVIETLVHLTTDADDPLVREACAAALGAIGDERGVPAILAACRDKPHVRRRAVLALAPFDGPEVDAAIEHALEDRDWQVRQAAEDLRRAAGERPL